MQTQYIEKNKNGTFYYKDKEMTILHREDGPAVVWADGDKWWFLNGMHHRVGGPACEYANGDKSWYSNGERHREDGPACEWGTGVRLWYLNGVHFSEEEFNAKMSPAPIELTIEEIAEKLGLDAKRLKVVA